MTIPSSYELAALKGMSSGKLKEHIAQQESAMGTPLQEHHTARMLNVLKRWSHQRRLESQRASNLHDMDVGNVGGDHNQGKTSRLGSMERAGIRLRPRI
jgi:hypothetical protein